MVSLLNAADLEAVMADFGRGSLEKDPVVHFYETFLAAYDPEKRKVRGVYYTPEPVVSYIVRAIDHLLKDRFGRPWGLADRNTLILDPACGTGTFLHSVISLIYDTLCAQGQAGGWPSYVSQSLLPRIFGFELLMAPYAVAHLKLGLLLQEKGFDFPPGQRLGVYLTNTLDEGFKKAEVLPLAGFITEESNSAARIKKEDPIEVVLGNPPYSGHSANASLRREVGLTGTVKTVRTFIGQLIEDYRQVDGKPLGEKNPKWLQDDYVKFLRWGQWRITQTGRGILAMITNHGYLDNPTFRGMRQQLMQTFSEIYLLNLHGNAKKKEVCPDGSKDENVFDIQQGVAIGLFMKSPDSPGPARVHYADLWGNRDSKNQVLAQMEAVTTPWRELQPHSPFYLFVPQDTDLRAEYDRGWKITDIMPVNGVGLTTARDHVVTDFEVGPIIERVNLFRDSKDSDKEVCDKLGIPMKKGWNIPNARRIIQAEKQIGQYIKPILYRAFDERIIFYHDSLIWRTVKQIMNHMLAGNNIGLCTSRNVEIGRWEHIFCTRSMVLNHTVSLKEGNYLFPLFIFQKVFDQVNSTPNINPAFIKDLSGKVSLAFIPDGRGNLETTFGPEDVFSYAYAVFHSPTYRQRYSEFLKGDFPRLPLTGNKALFKALVGLGAELASFHLMESPRLETFITGFPVPGSQVVEGVRYKDSARRVYINSEQYFEGVPPDVWAFTIGGYQVCHKWLKDRKGRTLSFEDLHHYQKIVVALAETIRLMGEIDAAIDANGGWPIN
jgi:predicted helicase